MRRNAGFYLSLIILTAILSGFFIYPDSFIGEWRPWRLGLDLVGGSHLVYGVDLTEVPEGDRESVLSGLRDVIERRVNLFGVSEPQVFIAKSGEQSQLIIELAGIRDIREAIKQIGQTPLLDFREVVQNGSSTSFTRTDLTGRYIESAQIDFDPTTQAPQVSLSFDEEGAALFEKITEANIGKPLCIFLDGQIDGQNDCPMVQGKITGGKAVITGRFTLAQARSLVERFNAGALPAPITLIDQLTVDPNLGSNSLRKAMVAGAIGTILVAVFMILYYGMFGVFATLALIIYILFSLALFKLIPVTLTLAGLAGFIITIGMAVDANVLIFERVKEELKKGLSKSSAIIEGFNRAWPSIRDSNTSTIISSLILYYFTSSFVKGFALTLLLGTIVSIFSAITTTRLFLQVFSKDTPKAK